MSSNHLEPSAVNRSVPARVTAGGSDQTSQSELPQVPRHGDEGSGTPNTITADAALARLEALRGELDAVDGRLRETLRERLDCCARIGRLKRDGAIPMMQPQRIGIVQQRAAAFAAEHGMSPTFLRAFYDLIITETCRIEDEIIAAKQAPV